MGRVTQLFLDLLSFNTPQARALNFAGILFIAATVPVSKLHYVPVRSVYESVFGLQFYSSGITRALTSLMHGDVAGAWGYNKLVFLVFGVIVTLLVINIVKSVKYYQQTKKLYPF